MSQVSPFQARYNAQRAHYPQAVLLFRIGDFYECFHSCAETCSARLGLTLTTRNKASESPIPMAGFPYHQLNAYLPKLQTLGLRVAVWEGSETVLHPSGIRVAGSEVQNADGVRVMVMTSEKKAASAAQLLAWHDHDDDKNDDDKKNETEETGTQTASCESLGESAERAETADDLSTESDAETETETTASAAQQTTESETFLQWKSEAGPRQTKTAVSAIRSFQSHSRFSREINDHGEYLVCVGMTSAKPCRAAVEVHNAIHATFGGIITAKNYKALTAEFESAQKLLELPVIDNRTTAEQRAERARQRTEQDAQNKAEAERRSAARAVIVAELRQKYPWAAPEGKFKTSSARAAFNLKEELKRAFPGVKFSVTSDSFSMGNSVDVRWALGPSAKEVNAIADKYESGSFNGMEDIYEYDRSDFGDAVETVLGRSKYVSCERSDSWELKHKLAPAVCECYGKPCDKGLDSFIHDNECYGSNSLRRLLCDIVDDHSFPPGVTVDDVTIERQEIQEFNGVADRFRLVYPTATAETAPAGKPCDQAASGATSSEFRIEKHFHTKRGADFWLVVPVQRLERSEYDRILTEARNAGGWQSRQWGKIPSGFGFPTESGAIEFVAAQSPQTSADSVSESANKSPSLSTTTEGIETGLMIEPACEKSPGHSAGEVIAEKFRTLADGMAHTIAQKLAPLSQNWTHKRGQEHASRVFEGERLKRAQTALYCLADHWEAGTVPPILRSLRTKTAVIELCHNRAERGRDGDSFFDSGEPTNHSAEAIALRELVASKTTDDDRRAQEIARQKQEVTRAENALRAANVPGFFPSPPAVCHALIDAAEIPRDTPGHFRILEPSAGIGSICETLTESAGIVPGQIKAIEIRPAMADVVRLKGFDVITADFLAVTPDTLGTFDRVLMNPPFERGADAEHVRHAFRFLTPGGILSAIVSAGIVSRTDGQSVAFRNWLESLGGIIEPLPAGSFTGADSFRQTGVSAYVLKVTAPRTESGLMTSNAEHFSEHHSETHSDSDTMATAEHSNAPQWQDAHSEFPELAFL